MVCVERGSQEGYDLQPMMIPPNSMRRASRQFWNAGDFAIWTARSQVVRAGEGPTSGVTALFMIALLSMRVK